MRLVLLAVVLATACDQGAVAASQPTEPRPLVIAAPAPTPAPPAYERYVVKDDQDFLAKAIVVIDELIAIFRDVDKDQPNCELLATRVETFAGANVTRFAVLTAYGKSHPEAEKLVQKQFEPRMSEFQTVMIPAITKCVSDQRLIKAFEKLAQDVNAQTFQQRPR